MSEMVEHVARAAYERWRSRRLGTSQHPDYYPPWEQADDFKRGFWTEIARAAIEAMREPTEAMMKIMRDELPLVDDPRHVGDPEFVRYWQATIDEALR